MKANIDDRFNIVDVIAFAGWWTVFTAVSFLLLGIGRYIGDLLHQTEEYSTAATLGFAMSYLVVMGIRSAARHETEIRKLNHKIDVLEYESRKD